MRNITKNLFKKTATYIMANNMVLLLSIGIIFGTNDYLYSVRQISNSNNLKEFLFQDKKKSEDQKNTIINVIQKKPQNHETIIFASGFKEFEKTISKEFKKTISQNPEPMDYFISPNIDLICKLNVVVNTGIMMNWDMKKPYKQYFNSIKGLHKKFNENPQAFSKEEYSEYMKAMILLLPKITSNDKSFTIDIYEENITLEERILNHYAEDQLALRNHDLTYELLIPYYYNQDLPTQTDGGLDPLQKLAEGFLSIGDRGQYLSDAEIKEDILPLLATNNSKSLYSLYTIGHVVTLEHDKKNRKLTIHDSEAFIAEYQYSGSQPVQDDFDNIIIKYIKKHAKNQDCKICMNDKDIIETLLIIMDPEDGEQGQSNKIWNFLQKLLYCCNNNTSTAENEIVIR